MTTDITEKGLETLIMRHLTGTDGFTSATVLVEQSPSYGGTGYIAGTPKEYNRAYALDVSQLFAFLRATQPEPFGKLALAEANEP
ncbi:MAG: hypothetical protein WCL42_10615, partial [Chlorobiaceae bacterium]